MCIPVKQYVFCEISHVGNWKPDRRAWRNSMLEIISHSAGETQHYNIFMTVSILYSPANIAGNCISSRIVQSALVMSI